jgi:signal transduction histidine kinase
MTAVVTGLRGRMLLALVATSLATLTVATLVVVPPLQRSLERDRVGDLRGLARTIRPVLRAIPAGERRRRSPALLGVVDRLQRRTGGRIRVYDSAQAELADTAAAATSEAPRLARERELVRRRRGGVIAGERAGMAFAVTVAGEGHDRITLTITKPLDDSRAAADVVRAALPLALGAGLAVALALALLLSRRLLRRLGHLRADAELLGSEGLAHRVSVTGTDEVSVVAQALEEMRRRLVDAQASRQEFVATASHELRTPLASLQATLELLEEELLAGRAAPEQAAARAQTALRQTHRLVGLATDLLDLSRVDGRAPLSLEPVELAELAETIAREFVPRLDAPRALRVEGRPALACADPGAVARILRVLLDNAVNYAEGAVTVTIATPAGLVELAVADEGPGLAADEREHVFRRFARGRAAAGSPGGAGLGLAIARGLAGAMGGTLEAEPAGAGTRFALRLRAANGDA